MERVLIITNTLGRWGETNGVEYTYNNLLKEFRKSNTRVDVLTLGCKDSIEEDGSVRIFTHRPRISVRYDVELRIDLNPMLVSSPILKQISSNKYSIVHSGTPDTIGMFGWHIAKNNRCPKVSLYHTVVDEFLKMRVEDMLGSFTGDIAGKSMWEFLSWYYKRSDLILAPTEYIKKLLEARLDIPIDILARGINTDIFNPDHRDRPENDNYIEIVYIGRVAVEKNMDMLLEVKKLIDGIIENKDILEIKYKVVGHGPYLDEFKKKFKGAEFTGKLTGKPLSRAFANGDIFVFPSRTDTFGNVVLQALSSGLPVIVTDSMGPREQIMEGKTGFISDTPEEFAGTVFELIRNRDLRKKMSIAAYKYAKNRSWKSTFNLLQNHYETAKRLKFGSDFPYKKSAEIL